MGWPGTAGLEIALPGRGFYTVIASADYAGAPTITAGMSLIECCILIGFGYILFFYL